MLNVLTPEMKKQLVALHPIGRVVWLSSDRAGFVTGDYYPIDWGFLAR